MPPLNQPEEYLSLEEIFNKRKEEREEKFLDTPSIESLFTLRRLRVQQGDPLRPEELEAQGFWKSAYGEGLGKKIPIIGALAEMSEVRGVYEAAMRMQDETATQEDEDFVLDWFTKQQIKSFRETNMASDAGTIVGESIPFVLEFLATRGIFTVSSKAAKKVILDAVKKSTAGTARKVVRKTIPAVVGASAQATVGGMPRIASGTYMEMMPELGLSVDDAGEFHTIITGRGRPAGEALMRSWADQIIEYGSERTGWMLGKMGRKLGKPLNEIADRSSHVVAVKQSVVQMYGRVKGLTGNKLTTAVNNTLKKGGWHGILGEIFEERVGAALRVPLDMMTGEEIVWEFGKMMERLGFTKDQFLTELWAFS